MSLSSGFSKEPDAAEAALWRAFRSHGSAAAREQLFTYHAAFARNIAGRHYHERSRGDIDLQDLHQLAYTGLLEAIDRFDSQRGVPFRPFAAHRISGSIRDGILRMSEVREQMSWRHRVHRERIQSLGVAGFEQEPIEKLTELVVGLALGFMLEGTGLFVPEDGGQGDIHTNARTAYDSLAWKEMITQLKNEMLCLPQREQTILRKHYLDGVGFDDLSFLLGISKGRISQLHHAALVLLRKRMARHGHVQLGNMVR